MDHPAAEKTMNDERGHMTPQELDELASAYLDGEATAEEAVLVESDPPLQTLVEELRTVRDLVAEPAELPSDEVRDQMIARALDHRAPVVSLEKARHQLRTVAPQARVVLAAAAVVAAIAVVGVTIFQRQGSELADDDMASAPAMADAPADVEPEAPAPVPAAEPESADLVEESLPAADAEPPQPDIAADAEPPQPDDLTEPEEEAASEDHAVAQRESLFDEPAESLSVELVEPQAMMADEAEVAPTSDGATLVFETTADLAAHAMQLAEEQHDPVVIERLDEAAATDLMGCPLLLDDGLELLARFDAIVDGVETQVSVYLTVSDLQLAETTPPPECELLDSHSLLDWSE